MMKRIVSALLILVMLLSLLCSCKDNGASDSDGKEQNGDTGKPDEGGENEGEDEMEKYVPAATVLAVKGGANGIVVLQHDDGDYDTAVIMDNLLREYGLVADAALLSNRFWNYSNNTPKTDVVEKWRGILDTGRWKVTSHSATHTWWGTASDNGDGTYAIADDQTKMYDEIVGSQKIFRQLFPDQRVLTFAYPGFTTEKNNYTNGSEAEILKYIYSDASRDLIGDTYIAGRRVQAAYPVTDTSIDWTMTGSYHIGGNYFTQKATQAGTDGTFMVLYVHKVANVPEDQLKTYDYPSNTMAAYYLEDTCKQLAAAVASGAVWNAHYEDAVMYLREAQSASVSVSGDKSGIRVNLIDGMDDDIYNFPLTLRISAPADWAAVKVTQDDKVSYAKVNYEAYEFYGGEYYALIDIVPDGGEATIEPIAIEDMPAVEPSEPKPSPSLPEPEEPETPAEDPNKPADARLYASFDFDTNYGAGFTDSSTCSTVERVTPDDRDNGALHISKTLNSETDRFYFDAGGKLTDVKEATISFSMKLNSSYNGLILQTLFTDSTNTTPYNLTVKTTADGFCFGELPGNKTLSGNYSYGVWHNVELNMVFGEDGSFLATLKVGGNVAGSSANFSSSLSTDSTKASRTISRIGLYGQKASTFDLYLDNVVIYVK